MNKNKKPQGNKTTKTKTKMTERAYRRLVYQTFCATDKARDLTFRCRDYARNRRRYDQVQFLTEAIAELSRANAWVRQLSRSSFQVEPERLESYK